MVKSEVIQSADYSATDSGAWSGRESDPSIGIEYWHQAIQIVDVFNKSAKKFQGNNIALIGYAIDEGVKRNNGREGAADGPRFIRERLGKLPYHLNRNQILDFGNFYSKDHVLEDCQQAFSDQISSMIDQELFPIALGGGHDMSYAHFRGLKQSRKYKTSRIGIVNFDAHFDLRRVEEESNSGTPFNQILSSWEETEYMVLGIQQSSNTKALYDIAKSFNVRYLENFDCQISNIVSIKESLALMIEDCDHIYVTIDMDCFSSAYAPGVSAPSPLGLTPYFVMDCLSYLLESKKVISFDIAESNPRFDIDNMTVNLAARLVDMFALKVSTD